MKIREYETYRGVYCGLCHTLRKRYGAVFRFAVNYDFTFLAMLLAGSEPVSVSEKRCPYHPLRRTGCPADSDSMNAAADYSVILAYWKLHDSAEDGRFAEMLGARFLRLLIRRGYLRAAERKPAFRLSVEENLRELSRLEASKCASIDAVADRFALILQAAALDEKDETRRRVLGELLYHLGRIVYILDAADDLADDAKNGNYNPLLYRFEVKDGKLSGEDEAELRRSMQFSHNSMASAFALLDKSPYTDILSNILFFGIPMVTQSVFSGAWRETRRERKERSRP